MISHSCSGWDANGSRPSSVEPLEPLIDWSGLSEVLYLHRKGLCPAGHGSHTCITLLICNKLLPLLPSRFASGPLGRQLLPQAPFITAACASAAGKSHQHVVLLKKENRGRGGWEEEPGGRLSGSHAPRFIPKGRVIEISDVSSFCR